MPSGFPAERVGFEPTVRIGVQRFSRPSRSTAPAPLHLCKINDLAPDAREQNGRFAPIGTRLAPNLFLLRFCAPLHGDCHGERCGRVGAGEPVCVDAECDSGRAMPEATADRDDIEARCNQRARVAMP